MATVRNLGAAACAGVVLAAAVSGAGAARLATPMLTLAYTGAGALEAELPDGTAVGAGSQGSVAPGAYQVAVIDEASDTTDPVHMFVLSGPGIDLMTDLQGGDDKSEIYPESLAANATYTFSDSNLPALGRIVIHTTGTPAPSSGGTPTTPAPVTTTGSASSSNSDVVGSGLASLPFRGALQATVAATGRLSLDRQGRRVTSLPAGRYAITVTDRSRRTGFVLQQHGGKSIVLSGAASTGTRTQTVALGAGQWLYRPTSPGAQTFFFVLKK
jgi:hypothetical protein